MTDKSKWSTTMKVVFRQNFKRLLYAGIFGVLIGYLWVDSAPKVDSISQRIIIVGIQTSVFGFLLVVLYSLLYLPLRDIYLEYIRLGIPKVVYPHYKQHLAHGKNLFKVAEQNGQNGDGSFQEQLFPVRVTKFARLVYNSYAESILMVSTTSNISYDLEAIARCEQGGLHRGLSEDIPAKDCTCGFYGTMSFDELLAAFPFAFNSPISAMVLLDSEFYGKVVLGSNGYRAEKQRVLKVSFLRYCIYCCTKSPKDVSPACVVGTLPGGEIGRFASECLVPLCELHETLASRVWTLDDVREQLQTEVDWYEITPL